jgi:hypothetical protein
MGNSDQGLLVLDSRPINRVCRCGNGSLVCSCLLFSYPDAAYQFRHTCTGCNSSRPITPDLITDFVNDGAPICPECGTNHEIVKSF